VTQVEQHPAWHQRLRRERKLRNWSQAYVAESIGSNTKTVSRWEQGKAFPGPYLRQKLVELFGMSSEELGLVFEQEEEGFEASRYWPHPLAPSPSLMERGNMYRTSRQEDWGEAPYIEDFWGRTKELAIVGQWITRDHCRVVAVLGIGGIGKTTFATTIAKQVQTSFEHVFWRSLQHAPPVESVVESYLRFVFPERSAHLPKDLETQLSLLVSSFRERRCLLILDNVESVMEAGQSAGRYRKGYEGYGRLLQRVGEAFHSSCLLLTSREKPREVARMEGRVSAVRVLELHGVEAPDGEKILKNAGLFGVDETWRRLVDVYGGNPLALKLVAEPIHEVFGGDIAGFLREEATVFGDIDDLLEEQFERLGELEQETLYWLAIAREAVSLSELRTRMLNGAPRKALVEALDSLRRRSMIESSEGVRFSLQPVIMEYVTGRFVEQVFKEIEAEMASGFLERYSLMEASGKEYVRGSQVRFILAVLAERLLRAFGQEGSAEKLKRILSALRAGHTYEYGPGNILNLLVQLGADLQGTDFSGLTVKQAYLQDVKLAGVNFAHANLATCVFTDTFSSIQCVALSLDGELLATGSTTGEISIWEADRTSLRFTRTEHLDGIRAVAFSPDGRVLVSGSEDGTLRLWDTNTGQCVNVLRGHTRPVRDAAFSPDGQTIASASEDATVRTWDAATGRSLAILRGHNGWVRGVAFGSDGNVLASSGEDETIRLWDTSTGQCFHVLHGHSGPVRAIAFCPHKALLASGGEDTTVRTWNTSTGECLQVLHGHADLVRAVAFSADGTMIASSSDDTTIQLWDSSKGESMRVLYGHSSRIWSIAFFPANETLVSASEDDTLRYWEVRSGQCTRTLHAYSSLIKAVTFSPDGRTLASASEDRLVRLWEVGIGQPTRTLEGHTHRLHCVAFSPDGANVVSGSEDETVRIWDTSTAQCLKVLQGHTHLVRSVVYNADGSLIASGSHDQTVRVWDASTGECLKVLRGNGGVVWSVAFSPDGRLIASASDDAMVRIWDVSTGEHINTLEGHEDRAWFVAFSPVGRLIASAGDDATIRLWDTSTGECFNILRGHSSWVRCIAFSPDGSLIASGSHDATIRLWDTGTGHCIMTMRGHSNCVWSVAFSPAGKTVASGGDDGTIRLWDVSTGECTQILRSERPYEGMNISGAVGLTEAQRMSLKVLGAVEVMV
jgi:WD40 repeat protein/transcriptional regulator with XRE-family HTH domain